MMKRKRSRKSRGTRMQSSDNYADYHDRDHQIPLPIRLRFFKIILPAILEQSKLRIPVEFVRKVSYQQDLSPFVTLTVPTGMSWKVIVSKKYNNVYFNEGWSKFMEHNHIQYGYFLDFEYLGNRHFRVHITNLTCCEIQYPVAASSLFIDANHQEDFPNASFTIPVRNSHFSSFGNYLHVPKSFVNKYMAGMGDKFVVTLQADDGREWNVDCYQAQRVGFRLYGAEWKKFTQENNWQLGDVYTFTMLLSHQGRTHLVLQVTKA